MPKASVVPIVATMAAIGLPAASCSRAAASQRGDIDRVVALRRDADDVVLADAEPAGDAAAGVVALLRSRG